MRLPEACLPSQGLRSLSEVPPPALSSSGSCSLRVAGGSALSNMDSASFTVYSKISSCSLSITEISRPLRTPRFRPEGSWDVHKGDEGMEVFRVE